MDFFESQIIEKRIGYLLEEISSRYELDVFSFETSFGEYQGTVDSLLEKMFSHEDYEPLRDYFENGECADEDDLDMQLVGFFGGVIAQALVNGFLLGEIEKAHKDNAKFDEQVCDFSEGYYEDVIDEITDTGRIERACADTMLAIISDIFASYGDMAGEPLDDACLKTLFDYTFGFGKAMTTINK